MTEDLDARELNSLQEIADEYRQQGYEVIIAPSAEQLPDFLRAFQPDIVAYNLTENVMVEVRTSDSLTEAPDLDEIAQILSSKDNWRFDLVVSNVIELPRHNKNDVLLNNDDIASRLQEANELSMHEHGEAALLLTWSALEAILRRNAQTEHVPMEQDNPLHLIKSLFIYGLISKEQYHTLRSGVQVRNTIVHGYRDKQSFSGLLQDLLDLANQLIERPLAA
ncbi:hypothetical protein KFU94_55960 [Chloroflexi bacterium TSY]|nr:hypothetical protein [Chloroflexi bacterium TSY]